jgi:hypothetical protein
MASFVEVVRRQRNLGRKNSGAIGKNVRHDCTMADRCSRDLRCVSATQDDLDAIVARAYTAMEESHLVFTRLGNAGAVSEGKVTLS